MFAGTAMMAVMLTTVLVGCDKDDDDPELRTTTYDLQVKDQLGVSGTVKFTEISNMVTRIEFALVGGDEASHPAHIHLNSAVVGGAIAITLNPVINGSSSTDVTKLDNNSAISYSQLLDFDGYVNVHQSSNDMNTIIAQADMGGNALTGNNKTYVLAQVGVSGVSGNALFEKRKNGSSLVTVTCTGTIAGGSHPAAIRVGSVSTVGGGPITKTLNPVNGATGKSYTQLSALNNGTSISYDNVLTYDGYLTVHESQLLMENVLCQGNIGSN